MFPSTSCLMQALVSSVTAPAIGFLFPRIRMGEGPTSPYPCAPLRTQNVSRLDSLSGNLTS